LASDEFVSRFKELWLSGAKYSTISKELGLSYGMIKYWRKRLGLPKRREPKPKIDIREVLELIKDGMTCKDVAVELGFKHISVVNALRRVGLSCRELDKAGRVFVLKDLVESLLRKDGVIITSEFYKRFGKFNVAGEPLNINLIKALDPEIKVVKLYLGRRGTTRGSAKEVFGKLKKYNNTYIVFKDWDRFADFVLKYIRITDKDVKVVSRRLKRSGIPKDVIESIIVRGLIKTSRKQSSKSSGGK